MPVQSVARPSDWVGACSRLLSRRPMRNVRRQGTSCCLCNSRTEVVYEGSRPRRPRRAPAVCGRAGTSTGGGIVGRPAFRGFSGILFATGLCFDRDFAGADMGRCLRRFRLRGDRENGDFGLPSARGVTAVSRAGPASEEGARAAGLGRLVDAPAEAGRLTLRACMRVTPASFRRLRRPRLLLGRGFGADGAWEDIFCSSTSICSQAFVCASA